MASIASAGQPVNRWQAAIGVGLVLLIAVVGLYIVKWNPYFQRAFVAAARHSIGPSIVSGQSAAPPAPSFAAAIGYSIAYFNAIWEALVLGLLLATTIETMVPRAWVGRILGSASFRATALGGVIAVPGMMCTCCASPVVVSMRRQGVSVGSALAFWLGSPSLNPATIVFIFFVLSWKWALLRLAAGLILVFGASFLAERLFAGTTIPADHVPGLAAAETTDRGTIAGRWLKTLGRLLIGLLPEYLIFVVILGAARAWLFPTVGLTAGNSLLVIIGLAIAGTLFVIPTAGEVPIIQSMLRFGMGTGPAGALLMTLAPISVPSVSMVWSVFPRQVLIFVVSSVAIVGILSGLVAIAFKL